ncbi:MAG: response regulator [Comamonadaceae bacterium]|nr:MAG: response regulator [Comamonadaceae bacterium]
MRNILSPKLLGIYAAVFLFLAGLGGWLIVDFLHERDRLLDDTARLAIHKSRFMSRAFGDTFLAADYVLRDVLGHVDLQTELTYPDTDPARARRLDALLKEKVDTVPSLNDLSLLTSDCKFAVVARHPLQGRKSNQSFCSESKVPPGQSLRIQYMPTEKSASRRPVVLMSRIVGSPEGRLLGGAMAVLDLEQAQNWIATFETDAHDVLAIVDTDSTLLARTPPLPQAIGKHAPPSPGQPDFGQVGLGATFSGSSPYDGRERVFGLSRFEHFPFVAIVGFDKTRVLLGWQHRAWQFTSGFVFLLALALLALRAHLTALRQREEMRQLAITDVLTGIANRRHLMEIGQREVDRTRRHGRKLALLMLDIDRFKAINDTWGHPTGDRVIQKLADTLRTLARTHDTCGRLGGEEFAVLLPETDLAGAQVIAERLRAAIEETQTAVVDGDTVLRFTVSIGAASLAADDSLFESLLQRGDKALYQAKEGGRNCVVVL